MADLCKPRVIVIGGPTATGKTALSVALAGRYGGEIISADSMQIYRGLDVGTAKVTQEEMQGVPHHLLNILSPEETFSVADFVAQAGRLIDEITARGHLPFVVGGTGLYISSLLKGVRFTEEKSDPEIRRRLQLQLKEQGAQELYERLLRVDPQSAEKIHPNNTVRVLRALELYEASGKTMTNQKEQSLPPEPPYQALCFALRYDDRETLYRRADLRIDQMMKGELLAEAEWVWQNRERCKTAAQAIGYKEFFPYFENSEPLENCVAQLKLATRHYVKRQLTWFGHMPDILWMDALDPQLLSRTSTEIDHFLNR